MHNWLGVLQHQLRVLWGLGRRDGKDKNKDNNEDGDTPDDPEEPEDEISELESDLTDLEFENQEWKQNHPEDSEDSTPRATPAPDGDSTPRGTPAPDEFAQSSQSGRSQKPRLAKTRAYAADNIIPMDVDEDEGDRDYVYRAQKPIDEHVDNVPPTTVHTFNFSQEEVEAIRDGIRNISLPTWVARPPTNLGEKTHGKLKADQLLILFTVIFPLLLPAIFVRRHDRRGLQSLYDLTASTNILVAFKTSDLEADTFTSHYTYYRMAIKDLHPEFESRPNHHYAMHNGDLLKYWGPLACLNEFAGERMNGQLQKVKINNHLCVSTSFFI
jgi:hypothetical protein